MTLVGLQGASDGLDVIALLLLAGVLLELVNEELLNRVLGLGGVVASEWSCTHSQALNEWKCHCYCLSVWVKARETAARRVYEVA